MPSFEDKSECHDAPVIAKIEDVAGLYRFQCTQCGELCRLQELHHQVNTIGLGEYTDSDLIAELVNRGFAKPQVKAVRGMLESELTRLLEATADNTAEAFEVGEYGGIAFRWRDLR